MPAVVHNDKSKQNFPHKTTKGINLKKSVSMSY